MVKLVGVTKYCNSRSDTRYILKNCDFEFEKEITFAVAECFGHRKTIPVKSTSGIARLPEGDILTCGGSIWDSDNLGEVRCKPSIYARSDGKIEYVRG